MALDGVAMGNEVAAAARAVFEAIPKDAPVSDASVDAVWKAIAQAIVDHIVDNGETLTTVTSGSSAGSYPGTIS